MIQNKIGGLCKCGKRGEVEELVAGGVVMKIRNVKKQPYDDINM